ncbi:hypothetical protein FCV25MIE_24884, partial [Fagus crenata]
AWVLYKEPNWIGAILWIIMLLCFCSPAHLMYLFQGYRYYIYEARVCFQVRVRVRYGGTPIPKKLGYG